MKKALKWIWDELLIMFPSLIYFFIIFSLADMTEVLMKKEYALHYDFWFVSLAALIMTKGVVLSDKLAVTHYFSHKPLIYTTVWKTFIYSLASLFIRLIEHVVHMLKEGASYHFILTQTENRIDFLPLWVGQMWLSLLLLVFVAYRELIYAVGPKKVWNLFFSKSI